MTNSLFLRFFPLFRAVSAVGFVAAVVFVSGAGGAKSEVGTQGIVSSFEVSILPKQRPTWQRPAPVTWSSRFNVRWEARWSSEGKYMA